MVIGIVTCPVVLQRAVPGAADKRFIQVRCGAALVTALDPIGAQPGQTVLLASGDSAARMCPEVGVDAVVLGVAEPGNNG